MPIKLIRAKRVGVDLAQFDIDNNYGRAALEAIMKAIMGLEGPLISPPSEYKGEFFDCINFSYLH